eukprot:UN32077
MRGWHSAGQLYPELSVKLFVSGKTDLNDKSGFIPLKDYARCSFTMTAKQAEALRKQTQVAISKMKKVKKVKRKLPKKWYYRDPEGTERGPFSIILMRRWFSKQYIPLDTPIRAEHEKIAVQIHIRRNLFEADAAEKANEEKKGQSLWHYIDDEGQIRGPFEKFVLKSWHEFGWLPYDIRVRRVGEKFFIPWGDRVKTFDDESDEETELSKKEKEFELEKLRPKKGQEQWYYMDDENAMQGPFTETAMAQWFEDGFFVSTTKIKKDDEPEFGTIRQKRPPWIKGATFPDDPQPGSAVPIPQMVMGGLPLMPGMIPPQFMMHPHFGPPDPPQWFYMASGEKSVGPFPTAQIQAWHKEGHFNDRVKVRHITHPPNAWKLITETPCAWKKGQIPKIPHPNMLQAQAMPKGPHGMLHPSQISRPQFLPRPVPPNIQHLQQQVAAAQQQQQQQKPVTQRSQPQQPPQLRPPQINPTTNNNKGPKLVPQSSPQKELGQKQKVKLPKMLPKTINRLLLLILQIS